MRQLLFVLVFVSATIQATLLPCFLSFLLLGALRLLAGEVSV